MRTLDELMGEFKSIDDRGRLRQNWIDNLGVSELKIMRDGFEKAVDKAKKKRGAYVALPWRAHGTWLYYTEELILKKIEENRNDKLNELGI